MNSTTRFVFFLLFSLCALASATTPLPSSSGASTAAPPPSTPVATTVPVPPPDDLPPAPVYTAEQLHDYLSRGTNEQQSLAATELSRLGLTQLLTSAAHPEPMVRYHAVNALGTLGDPAAVPSLLDISVKDDFLFARHRAIWALGTIAARDGALARRVMGRLQELHHSRSAPGTERWRAVLALGLLGDVSMGHHITSILASTEDETLAWEGLNTLATTPCNTTASVTVIYPFLTHSTPRVAEAAVRAMAKVAETHNNSAHAAALAAGEVAAPEDSIATLARRALAAAAKVHSCPQIARRAKSLGEAMRTRRAQQLAERVAKKEAKMQAHVRRFNLKSEL